MKKVIEGKVYNTQTAKEVVIFNDFNYWKCLYRTRTGNWFVFENNVRTGKSISPMTEEETSDWLVARKKYNLILKYDLPIPDDINMEEGLEEEKEINRIKSFSYY